jgi:hypothetical protein
MKKLFIALLLPMLLSPVLARAVDFTYPAGTKPGHMDSFRYPVATIDGKAVQLGAGAKVYDENHRIILPNFVPQQANVMYLTDSYGQIYKMWIQPQ